VTTTETYTLSLHDALPISFGWSVAGNVTTIINPTMTNEFQFGKGKNGIPGDAPPAGSPYYRSVSKITIPLLYPNADPSGLIPNLDRKSTRLNSSHVSISYA